MAGVLDIGRVRIARPRAFAAAVTFSPGDYVYTSIDYNNETGSAQTRDILVGFGTYDEATKWFSEGGKVVHYSGYFYTGTGLTFSTDSWYIPTDIEEGTYNVSVWLGDYNLDTGEFTCYSASERLEKEDYLIIRKAKPKYMKVTDFDILPY